MFQKSVGKPWTISLYVCIPDSVKEIAADAFDGCNNLTILCPEGSAAHDYAILKEIPYLIR